MKRAALGIAIASVLCGPAQAQSVKLIGEFRSWSAYSASEQTGPVCFAMTRPTEISPQPDGFTEAYLYLTHRPALGVRNELNLGVPEAVLATRRAAWKPAPPRETRGALAKYARQVSSASLGAVTDR